MELCNSLCQLLLLSRRRQARADWVHRWQQMLCFSMTSLAEREGHRALWVRLMTSHIDVLAIWITTHHRLRGVIGGCVIGLLLCGLLLMRELRWFSWLADERWIGSAVSTRKEMEADDNIRFDSEMRDASVGTSSLGRAGVWFVCLS